MNDRQNAQQIIAFGAPERVLTGVPAHTVAFHGANHEGFHGGGHHLPVGSEWTDIWGVQWRREQEGVMGFPRGHPLSDLPDALDRYTWPDPEDPRICNTIYQQAAGWDAEAAFLVGSHRDTLWEKSYMLVGMESMMVSFHLAPTAAREVLHRIMDFHLGIARHYAAVGVEMVTMTDDLGTQRGLLLSPQIIEEFLVPEYARLFAFYKERGVLVNFHSCGHILPWWKRLWRWVWISSTQHRLRQTTSTSCGAARRGAWPCRAASVQPRWLPVPSRPSVLRRRRGCGSSVAMAVTFAARIKGCPGPRHIFKH